MNVFLMLALLHPNSSIDLFPYILSLLSIISLCPLYFYLIPPDSIRQHLPFDTLTLNRTMIFSAYPGDLSHSVAPQESDSDLSTKLSS